MVAVLGVNWNEVNPDSRVHLLRIFFSLNHVKRKPRPKAEFFEVGRCPLNLAVPSA